MNKFINSTLKVLAMLLLLAPALKAEVAIIVHPDNPLATLSPEQAANLFLGKTKAFPDGSTAIPIDQEPGNDARSAFAEKVLKRTESQIKAYWSRLIFTGKGKPPKMVEDSEEMMGLISSNPNLIGYIEKDEADDSVKVVLTAQ